MVDTNRLMPMGRCPNCTRSGLFLKTEICKSCGKEGCDKCFQVLFHIMGQGSDAEGYTHYKLATWYVCSWQCLEKFADLTIKTALARANWCRMNVQELIKQAIFDPQNKLIDEKLREKVGSVIEWGMKNRQNPEHLIVIWLTEAPWSCEPPPPDEEEFTAQALGLMTSKPKPKHIYDLIEERLRALGYER